MTKFNNFSITAIIMLELACFRYQSERDPYCISYPPCLTLLSCPIRDNLKCRTIRPSELKRKFHNMDRVESQSKNDAFV